MCGGDPDAMRPRNWPVYRQLTGTDRRGLGAAAKSDRPRVARTSTADRVVKSVCPYCAVGCGQNVYVKDGKVIQIEGDPDSPGQPRPAVPEGVGQPAAHHGPARAVPGQVPPAVRHRLGGPRTSTRRWT